MGFWLLFSHVNQYASEPARTVLIDSTYALGADMGKTGAIGHGPRTVVLQNLVRGALYGV